MNLPWQSADRHFVLIGLPGWKWVLSSQAGEIFLISSSEMVTLTGWLVWFYPLSLAIRMSQVPRVQDLKQPSSVLNESPVQPGDPVEDNL